MLRAVARLSPSGLGRGASFGLLMLRVLTVGCMLRVYLLFTLFLPRALGRLLFLSRLLSLRCWEGQELSRDYAFLSGRAGLSAPEQVPAAFPGHGGAFVSPGLGQV